MGCRVLSSNDYQITCGYQSHQKRERGRQHTYGVDIVSAGYLTSHVKVHSDGIVKRVVDYIVGHEADKQGYGYGNHVIIEHMDGVCTIYCHLLPGAVYVKEGQNVAAGEVIGYMGNTGSSTGAHLDFSVIKLKSGYEVEDVDILKDIDVKFNAYDPELYLDKDLPVEGKIIERVQAGSFTNPEYAIRRYDLLKSMEFPVIIKFWDNHYRCQVGAYEDHQNAVNMFNKLQAKDIDCYITTEAGKDIDVDELRSMIL